MPADFEALPHVDEHSTVIEAGAEATWEAWLAEREALANLREATGENYPLQVGGAR